MNMQHRQAQTLKQTQRLIMSPQMQQAIHLLQMPMMELNQAIEAEMQQNPVLEYSVEEASQNEGYLEEWKDANAEAPQDADTKVENEMEFSEKDFDVLRRLDEDFRDHFAESGNFSGRRTAEEDKLQAFKDSLICEDVTLFSHVMRQAKESFDDPVELAAAEVIAGHFDERGFLDTSLTEIALLNDFEEDILQVVLDEIQSFDPIGIGAANLQESLLIQLKALGKGKSLAYQIIEGYYEDLLNNRMPLISKQLGEPVQDIRAAIESDIAKLDLKPGMRFGQAPVQHVTADVTVKQEGGRLVIDVNDDRLPPIRLSSRYLQLLDAKETPKDTKDYVQQKVQSGKWLLRNIHQRNETILRITEYLVEQQRDFFASPEGKLLPMTMKTVAEELELHESTIARAVANKYIDCDRGLLSLRSFFTNAYVNKQGDGVSSRTVKDALLEVIENEDKAKPLSDEGISKEIEKRGVKCARRTVAKYRRELNIGNASQRRQYG